MLPVFVFEDVKNVCVREKEGEDICVEKRLLINSLSCTVRLGGLCNYANDVIATN